MKHDIFALGFNSVDFHYMSGNVFLNKPPVIEPLQNNGVRLSESEPDSVLHATDKRVQRPAELPSRAACCSEAADNSLSKQRFCSPDAELPGCLRAS